MPKKNEALEKSPAVKPHSLSNQQSLWMAGQLLGYSKAFHSVVEASESQYMQALMTLQENELWRDVPFDENRNCEDFDEFLSVHGHFGKSVYYQKKALIEKEGFQVFDGLNQIGIPAVQRKQLAAGSITIDGEEVIINDERVPISDKKRIKVLISTLTEKVEAQSRQLEKGQASFEKMKTRALDAEKRAKEASSTVPLRELRQTELIVAITGYADAVRAEPYTDSGALKLAVERIGDALAPLWRALGTTPTSGLPSTGDKDLDSAIDALLDDEDPSETE